MHISARQSPIILALFLTSISIVAPEARADYLILNNGDRLTGTIASQSPASFVIVTALVGRVVVKRTDVASLTRDRTAAPDTSPATTRPPGWSGAINAGVDISHGNSPSSTMIGNSTLTRVGLHDKLGLFGASLVSSTGWGDAAVTTVRSVRGGARYDHDLTPRLFGFGFADVEHDALQLLALRTVTGGGAGLHAVKSSTTQVNVTAGASFAHDAYASGEETTTSTSSSTTPPEGGPSVATPGRGLATAPGQTRRRNGTPPAVVRTSLRRDVGEFVIGEDLWHQVNDAVSVTERLALFPAIGEPSDFRVSFDLALSVRLSRWVQWNLTLADRYLHIPPAGGAVQNDAFVSTGLGIVFGSGTNGAYTGSDGRRAR